MRYTFESLNHARKLESELNALTPRVNAAAGELAKAEDALAEALEDEESDGKTLAAARKRLPDAQRNHAALLAEREAYARAIPKVVANAASGAVAEFAQHLAGIKERLEDAVTPVDASMTLDAVLVQHDAFRACWADLAALRAEWSSWYRGAPRGLPALSEFRERGRSLDNIAQAIRQNGSTL